VNESPILVMADTFKLCESCGRAFTEAESTGNHCFKCKVDNVNFGFRGVTGFGRAKFHDETIRSVVEASDRDIRSAGGDPKKDFEFSGKRWV